MYIMKISMDYVLLLLVNQRVFLATSANLEVSLILESNERKVHEGDEVDLKCAVRSFPLANVTWYKDDIAIDYVNADTNLDLNLFHWVKVKENPLHMMTTEYKMRVVDVAVEGGGEYTCRAQIGDVTDSDKIHLNVLKRDQHTYRKRGADGSKTTKLTKTKASPYIDVHTQTRIELESVPVRFLCRSESSKPVDTQWYMLDAENDQKQTLIDEDTQHHLLLASGDLMVLDSRQRQEGMVQYMCQVSNEDGTDRQTVTHIVLKE